MPLQTSPILPISAIAFHTKKLKNSIEVENQSQKLPLFYDGPADGTDDEIIGPKHRPVARPRQSLNLPTVPRSSSKGPLKRDFIDLTLSEEEDDIIAKETLPRPPRKKHASESKGVTPTSSRTSSRPQTPSAAANLPASISSSSKTNFQIIVPSRDAVELANRQSRESRQAFLRHLGAIPGPPVTLVNDIDDASPPINFKFIDSYEFGPGTAPLAPEFQTGCDCKPLIPNAGCAYLSCTCLEESARDKDGKVKGFPYYDSQMKRGCLREFWLESREPIYECNHLCRCSPGCKNKVVQKGRQIPLEIFKTRDRGFGLRSPVAIAKGQFVDTYRGEVITDAEATRREKNNLGKDSYLYSLDKFKDDEHEPIADEDLFVVDGEHMGGPTRFINHSCDPNLRQFTVSLTRGDRKVYDLAFFALTNIAPKTELTFDYKDSEEAEEGEKEEGEGGASESTEGQKPVECRCGSRNCRGILWS